MLSVFVAYWPIVASLWPIRLNLGLEHSVNYMKGKRGGKGLSEVHISGKKKGKSKLDWCAHMHLGVAALQDHPPRSVYKAQSNDPGGWRPLWHQVEDPLDLGKLLHLMGVGTRQGRDRLPHAGVVTWHPRQNSAQTLPKNLLNTAVFSGNALTVFAQLNTLRAPCADWTAPRISFCSISALWKEWVWIWTSFRSMTMYARNWGNTRAHQSKAKSDETPSNNYQHESPKTISNFPSGRWISLWCDLFLFVPVTTKKTRIFQSDKQLVLGNWNDINKANQKNYVFV